MLGLAVALVVLAGVFGTATGITAELAFVLVAGYIGLALASLARFALPQLNFAVPQISNAIRMSPAARQATQRARGRANYSDDTTLTDIGMIINERRRDGQWNRHLAQIVSLDDDAIQPFAAVHADADQSNRLALIQFDIFDQTGRQRFSRQCEQWVREGINLIVCDRQLPLQPINDENGRSGVWDLRITIDGSVVGVHSFTVTPSTADRRRQFNDEGETDIGDIVDDGPVSLEDLLREQPQQGSASRR
jgi:hypothetical protein